MEKVRVNMYLPKDLKDWYWVEAEKQGFNFTTMVQVAMLSYKKEQEALELSRLVGMTNRKQGHADVKNDTDIKGVLVDEFRKIGYDLSWDGDTPIVK